MHFPEYRARRTRSKESIRRLLRETLLAPQDLISPLWVVEGKGIKQPCDALPGIYRYSIDQLAEPVGELARSGVGAVMIFALPKCRDALAKAATDADGIVPRAIKQIKASVPDLCVFTDVSLSAYTEDGSVGVMQRGKLDDEATLEILGDMAVAHGRAGPDFVCPSAGLDGQVGWIRETLDEAQLDDIGIAPCSVRYRSVYAGAGAAGALDVAPTCSDAGELDPANAREAIREVTLDVEEGADMIMIEPALGYRDVIARLADEFELPLVACAGPGEYQLIEAAANRGWIDAAAAITENLVATKRSGADAIITYHALRAARLLAE